MDLIDRDALFNRLENVDDEMDFTEAQAEAADQIIDICVREIKATPAVEAVPLYDLCVWLAAYTDPPSYALYETGADTARQVPSTNQLVYAWQYHFRQLMECGLIGGTADESNS